MRVSLEIVEKKMKVEKILKTNDYPAFLMIK